MPSDEPEVTQTQPNNAASSAPIAAVFSSGTQWRCRPWPRGVWRKCVCRKAAVALLAVLSCALFLKDAVWQSKSLREFDDSALPESSALLAAAYGTYASQNLTVQFVQGMAGREHWPLAWREGCVTFTRGCGPLLEARIRVPVNDQIPKHAQADAALSLRAESGADAAAATVLVTAAAAAAWARTGHNASTTAIAGGEGHTPGRGSSAAHGTARCASDLRQLVCVLDSANTKGLPHVAHLAQSFFPCWSLFLEHPHRERVILLNDSYTSHGVRKAGRYATDLAAAMGARLVTFEATAGLCGTGTGLQGHIGGGMQWFDRGGDAAALRDAVLALSVPRRWRWRWPPSSWLPLPDRTQQRSEEDATNINFNLKLDQKAAPLRVGLLDRAIASGRHLVHHAAIVAAVAAYHGAHGQAVEVEHAVMDGRTLRQQAEWFSRFDVIVSPHGNQLTNAAFGRRCAVLLELFPLDYVMPVLFPSLARDAGMLPYYLTLAESMHLETPSARFAARAQHIYYTADEVMEHWGEMMGARERCLAGGIPQ